MVEQAKIRATFADYDALPETNQQVELIDGEIIMVPAPLDIHQQLNGDIYTYIRAIVPSGAIRIAPTGVRLGDHVVEPDIFWVSADNQNCSLGPDGRYWLGAPDLVVEILLPSTASRDYREKFDIYETHGVREYWIVEPAARYIDVYQRDDNSLVHVGNYSAGDENAAFQSVMLSREIPVNKLFSQT